MALNKQRILSELGSVVNQLQSADCGCMGKLFGTTPQNNMRCMNNSYPQPASYGHGCHASPCHGCHQGSSCCRESYPINSMPQRPYTCMGQCNAPKLYADTYNYLNKNLMQPVVKEVYNDLSSLNPTNTIMNNEMGSKMGITQQGQDPVLNKTHVNNMNTCSPHVSQMKSGLANTNTMQNSPCSAIAPNQQYFGGMGPQIVNMFKGESNSKPMQPQQGLTGPMIIDAPQSPHGTVGVTPLTGSVNSTYSTQPHDSIRNNFNQQQIYAATTSNSPSNQIQQTPLMQPSYGQHTQGMKKFNEMFPGVMQGLGGDLGFDPMAIAIQMNPANQQQVAMNTMQKIMNNNQNISRVLDPSIKPEDQQRPDAIQNTGQIPTTHQNDMLLANGIYNKQNLEYNQQNISQKQENTVMPVQNQQMMFTPVNQSMVQRNITQPQGPQIVDPNTAGQNLSTIPEDPTTLPQKLQSSQNNHIKEPIYPVDTTKQNTYHNLNVKKLSEPAYYNTLGQPVEKFPANMYRPVLPNLPQTLSPQPTNVQAKYSKVKPTVSKTSLMGEKPTDKTPSRSQLQQIYKQFKGSQSYTKQNVTTPPVDGPTHSERHLNVKQNARTQNVIPVEKVGGDSAAGGQFNNIEPVRYDNIGDVPVQNKPGGDPIKPEKELAGNNVKGRNGLQDMVYTSYPTSAAWTFHGDGKTATHCPSQRGRRYHRY